MTRTAIQQQTYDLGRQDATDGRPATPPEQGGELAKAYLDGYQSVAPAPAPAPKSSSSGTSRQKGRQGSSKRSSGTKARPAASKARSGASRGRSRRRNPVQKAGTQLAAPVSRSVTSALAVVGAGAAIAFSLNLLNNAEAAGGFLGGIAKGIAWLDDPTKSIPYRK